MTLCFEAMIPGIAEKLKLPGFGEDAFGESLDLKHPDDFCLHALTNLAFGEKPDGSESLPDADEAEMKIFREARRYLPASVYDEAR